MPTTIQKRSAQSGAPLETRLSPSPFHRVLVPVDGSAQAEQVLPLAMRIAQAGDGDLDLLWVWPQRGMRPEHDPDGPMASARRNYLEALVERVGDRIAGPCSRSIRTGRPADAILRHIEESGANLVVMASRGHGGLWRLGIGSTTEAVVHRSTVPVIVLRAPHEFEADFRAPVRLDRVVVALDGSAIAEAILEPAIEFALLVGAEIELVRVVQEFAPAMPGAAYMPHPIQESRGEESRDREAATAYLAQIAAGMRASGLAVRASVRAARSADEGILRFVRESDADLVAVATHGHGRASRLLLGSTATRVLHHASVPVMIGNPHV